MEGERAPAGFLADRTGWRSLVAALSARRVPGKSFVHYLGGVTLMLLLVDVLSGILLLLYYRPDPAQAFGSVAQIIGEVPYGNLIRAVHLWASDLFIAALVAHLFSIVLRRSFQPPRELVWLSGCVASWIGVLMAYTGAILPWSQLSYTEARVGSELAGQAPLVGEWLRRFLRGGDEVNAATLQHVFGFHVAALPAAVTLLIALHILLLQRGRAPLPQQEQAETIPVYPDFLLRQAVVWTGAFVILMTLATFAPRALGDAADARLPTAPDARPPWFFLWIHQLIRIAPRDLLGIDGPRFVVGACCALACLVVALPFLDRRGWKVTTYLASGLLFVLVLLTAYALT
jgi:quinol-cytochrome oxidoreductase complex cytochrome b subunit